MPPYAIASAGIARTFQNLGLFPHMSVRDNVLVGAHHRGGAGFLTASLWLPRVRREEARLRAEADRTLERLALARVADHPATGLPFGTLKRVELARALAGRPRLLLLDEPVNGLSSGEVAEFSGTLRAIREEFDVTVVVVEHHMGFVMGVCDRVVCLDFGRKIAEGLPRRSSAIPRSSRRTWGQPYECRGLPDDLGPERRVRRRPRAARGEPVGGPGRSARSSGPTGRARRP
nr:hypothetical protein GCM10020093_010200 [Planobispora longispora]